jgi:hypothetical protein
MSQRLTLDVMLKRHARLAELLAVHITEKKLYAIMRLSESKYRRPSWLRSYPVFSKPWQERHSNRTYRESDAIRLVLPKNISPEMAIEISKIIKVKAYDILHAHNCDRLKELGVKI